MYNNFNLFFFLFIISCLMFSFTFKHMLLTLITLEFMMLNMFYLIYFIITYLNFDKYFLSLFLTIMICESVIGLTLMIFMTRMSGNDYSKSINLLKW